ncbi:unnamed protein product [Prunus armeniaca]
MVTIFKSYGLWNLVEKGIPIPDSKKKKETKEASEDDDHEKMAAIFMKDAKALGIIKNVVSDQIFPRIANADSTKMAWELVYGEYHGSDHMRSVKLQNLIHEFEYTRMRDNESLYVCLTRLNELINQMKTFVDTLSNERLVQKVLISLTEKTFASFSVSPKGQNKGGTQSGSSKFQKNWNPKGKPWESKSKFQQTSSTQGSSPSMNQEGAKPQCKVCSKFHFGECRHKGKPKCYNCDKFGHWARECIASKNVQKANCANQVEVTGNLFYANSTISRASTTGEWYIDSGCRSY